MTTVGGRVVIAIATVALVGAALFGLWHLVVGGFINGNPRAGTFGLVLAIVAGVPLVLGTWLIRRRRGDAVAA
jgi:hypothetical protein